MIMIQWSNPDENIRMKHIFTPQDFLKFLVRDMVFLQEDASHSIYQTYLIMKAFI